MLSVPTRCTKWSSVSKSEFNCWRAAKTVRRQPPLGGRLCCMLATNFISRCTQALLRLAFLESVFISRSAKLERSNTHTHTGVYVCSSSRAFNLSRLDKFATASQRKLHGSVAKFFAIAPRPLSNFSKVLLEISQLGPSLISTVIRFWPKHWSCLLILFGEQTLTV